MRSLLVVATIATALSAAGTAAFAAPRHAAACTPGMKKIDGVPARTFCGPARATVRINRKTVLYTGGRCEKSPAGWSINIGTVVLGAVKTRPEYFGITVAATPGSHANAAVAVNHAGQGLAVTGNTVTLRPGLKSGTFTGSVFGASSPVSGSFSC
jgi:hypothetical protein